MESASERAEERASSRIRMGVVGVGYLGKYHAEKYAAMPGVDLVGLVDVDLSRCEELSARYGCKAWSDHRELLDRVDAVSIVVPTAAHHGVARDFLEAGRDVLVEKPITRTLEEADDLLRIAEANGRFIQVGHLEQFNPAVKALKEMLTTPLFIESHRIGPFKERGTDVDVVLDLMIHDLDIILSCVRSDLETIQAVGVPVVSPHVDIANVRLGFKNGCVANVTASRISLKVMRKIRIFQPDAYFSLDYADRSLTVVERISDGKEGPARISARSERYGHADPLEEELKAFVHSVATRTPPEVDGKRGREALRVSLDIVRQISDTLERVPVPESSRGRTP